MAWWWRRRPGLACRTLTAELPKDISLAPLPVFELIGDLSVNTGKWMRDMSERLEAWAHTAGQEVDLRLHEERMEPDLADKVFSSTAASSAAALVATSRHGAHARGIPEQQWG